MLYGRSYLGFSLSPLKIVYFLGLFASWMPLAHAQMPPPKVEVIKVSASEIRHWDHFSGRISAVESVEVRPLVGGRIDQILFKDGQLVKRGQALFVIDPRPFEAAVKQAEATLSTAKAQARLTRQEHTRSQELLDNKLISQSIYDEALTANDVAKAAVLQAEGQLLNANLNLEYAHIVAPISGRVGRAELTAGNIVGAGPSAPLLTTIVAESQVYAEFRVDEQSYLDLLENAQAPSDMPVFINLSNNAQTVYEGHVHAFDNQLDAASGTIRARAVFNNTDGVLIPGMYANVRIGSAIKQQVYLVPERAIGTNQNRKFVYIIDEQNLAQYREVTLGDQFKGQRVVRSGLTVGEHVAVNGLSHIRPQAPVDIAPASLQEVAASSEH
ncbi:efflux RND transporter periplasmic adaptor subunit [Teredinibacter haidensis]|uniref:efflux RND transporter periplasmic adaptor subunit n=1 Tax=Teredinibacter haidensis TaxID=2731755 RepID=UPI000948E4F7|nr:efflux RND transporter periplasmic adaptor subunit [Teredinibacter haidensis]